MGRARGELSSLADVARRAGVSITTASRVMSESPHPVAEHTRRRVLAAADELDFEPNLMARGLVAQRTSMVAVLVDDLTDPAAALVARGVEDDAFEHGFSVVVGDTDGDVAKEVAYVRKLRALRADAVVLATAAIDGDVHREELARQLLKLEGGGGVVVRVGPGREPSDVAWSEPEAFELAVRHLRTLGHEHLAFVTRGDGHRASAAVEACRAALGTDGGLLPPDRVLAIGDPPDGVARVAHAICVLTPSVTGVLTASDEDAAALIAALQSTGRRVPHDVSVCGLGDLPVATVVSPALTTVRLPLRESGRAGMCLVRDALDGERPGRPTELPVELVVRDSTGPAPA